MQFHYAVSNSVGKIRQKPAASRRRHWPDDGMVVDRLIRAATASARFHSPFYHDEDKIRRPETRGIHFF